jgi:DNA-binding MarR family transcriptional regulator/predicted GNAT family acetyltransferase
MNFYDRTGKMAIGSRLRRLAETITQQSAQVYELYQVDFQPKWFPVFFSLADGQSKGITEIATEIGHSHPSVSTMVKEMVKKGYLKEQKGITDGRRNVITMTEKGLEVSQQVQSQYIDVGAAVEKLLDETDNNLWKAIGEWEFHLEQKDLLSRVKEERKLRESGSVKIVNYAPEYKQAFGDLNKEWITQHFVMEEADYKALDHPEEYILDKGGYILMAIVDGKPVGTCGLIKMDDETFELAKMAVSPSAKGKGIGYLLGKAVMDKAKEAGATKVYLESNTKLKPAIALYHKLGFKKITGRVSPYERSNIAMEVQL